MTTPALEIAGLRTEFRINGAWHAAVRDPLRCEALPLLGGPS